MRMIWQVMPGRFLDYQAMSQRAADVMLGAPAFVDGVLANSIGYPIRYLTYLNWTSWEESRAFTVSEPWYAFNKSEAQAGALAVPLKPQEAFDRVDVLASKPASFYKVVDYTLAPGRDDEDERRFAERAVAIAALDCGLVEAQRFVSWGNPAHVGTLLGFETLDGLKRADRHDVTRGLAVRSPIPAASPIDEDVYSVITRYQR